MHKEVLDMSEPSRQVVQAINRWDRLAELELLYSGLPGVPTKKLISGLRLEVGRRLMLLNETQLRAVKSRHEKKQNPLKPGYEIEWYKWMNSHLKRHPGDLEILLRLTPSVDKEL